MIRQYTAKLILKANQSHCFLGVSYPSESTNDEERNCNMIDMLIILMSYCWICWHEWWDLVGTKEKKKGFPLGKVGICIWWSGLSL